MRTYPAVIAVAAMFFGADSPGVRPSCLAASQPPVEPPEAAAATSPEPLLGIRIYDPRVVECVALVEAGKGAEAVTRLRELTRGREGPSLDQLNELRLGLGFVLLRDGQVQEARKLLLPLSKMADRPREAHRAKVLYDIASRWQKKRIDDWPLRKADRWRDALLREAADIAGEARGGHQRLVRTIVSEQWSKISIELELIRRSLHLLEYIDLPQARQTESDALVEHAASLAAEVRDINVYIARVGNLVSDLTGQMSSRSDSTSGRRGYLPAHVVERHNALIDMMAAANEAGERLVTEYRRVIDRCEGRLKKDASVKMSKTRLPAKREVFRR